MTKVVCDELLLDYQRQMAELVGRILKRKFIAGVQSGSRGEPPLLKPLFERSPFGVYLYVDDHHKICNERMAQMHGMTVEEWRNTPTFLNDFIAEEDREMYAGNYHHHVAGLQHPVTFRFRGLRKDGSTFAAETDMIPLCWRGHAVAYHFVREIS